MTNIVDQREFGGLLISKWDSGNVDFSTPNGYPDQTISAEQARDLVKWLSDEPKAVTHGKLDVKPGDKVTVTLPGSGHPDGDYIVSEDGVTLIRADERTT